VPSRHIYAKNVSNAVQRGSLSGVLFRALSLRPAKSTFRYEKQGLEQRLR